MNIQSFIFFALFVLTVLIVLSAIKTLINKKKLNKILEVIKNDNVTVVENLKCYYSAIGMKKNYPGYPARLTIYLTNDMAVFSGKHKFPFVFHTYENLFIISKNPINTRNSIDLGRIFKPEKVSVSNSCLNLNFIDNLGFKTTIDYQIELNSADDREAVKIIEMWI